MCCHTTFSKTLYFHVLVVGKLGRLRKSHTTCKRCYLMLLLLDYHIPSFFSKKRQLLALLTPLTYITLYYWYFDVRYTKKYNARRRALYVIMLLFHYYYMQLQCYKRVLLEKEERGKNFRKIWKNVMHLTTYAEIDVSDHALDFWFDCFPLAQKWLKKVRSLAMFLSNLLMKLPKVGIWHHLWYLAKKKSWSFLEKSRSLWRHTYHGGGRQPSSWIIRSWSCFAQHNALVSRTIIVVCRIGGWVRLRSTNEEAAAITVSEWAADIINMHLASSLSS